MSIGFEEFGSTYVTDEHLIKSHMYLSLEQIDRRLERQEKLVAVLIDYLNKTIDIQRDINKLLLEAIKDK